MKNTVLLILFFLSFYASAQIKKDSVVDYKYLEDQFYIGLTYNFVAEIPEKVSQRNLSYGLRIGFIKDMPISASRRLALGVGAGYATYSYYSNLRAFETASGYSYALLDTDTDVIRNKIDTHVIEVPLEFRWRDSSPADFKFWRIYSGVTFGYVVASRSKAVGETKDSFYNTDVRKVHYGLTLNAGYNTWNVHVYYGLNSLMNDDVKYDGNVLKIIPVRVGVVFYIL